MKETCILSAIILGGFSGSFLALLRLLVISDVVAN
jgi:hypothetical protein